MIKVSKAYVLVAAGLLVVLMSTAASAAFGFSFPLGTIVGGPGLAAAGPSTFNTYFNDATMANAGASTDAAVNGFGSGVPFGVPGLPCLPCGGGFGFSPFGVANAANALTASNWGESNTFATSFSSAGGLAAGCPGLGETHFAGSFPEFGLNLY